MAPMFKASWPIEPRQFSQSAYAAVTPMLAAAGIVVTEMSTPISAPDFEVDSDSIPAAPAQAATKNVKKSGLEITLAIEWDDWSNVSSLRSVALKISVARNVVA